MTRAFALFTLGVAILLVGAASACVAHRNHVLASALAQNVHRNQDVRAEIEERAHRVMERRAQLRVEHERDWHVVPERVSTRTEIDQ